VAQKVGPDGDQIDIEAPGPSVGGLEEQAKQALQETDIEHRGHHE
jgi:hypothetical protein